MHPTPLRPLQAQRVVDRVRKKLRRKTAVPVDRLRDERIAWELLQAWSDQVSNPPQLANTDGDPILLTEERWSFDPSNRDVIVQRIAGLENAEPDEPETGDSFTILREGNRMHKDWDNTVIAHLKIGDSTLTATTNSLARADSIRERIETACGSLLKTGMRTHTDPASVIGRSPDGGGPAPVATAEEAAMVREMKESHYAQWLKDSIPALGGKTPHEAARTKSGRARLATILDEIELAESREAENARFDVGKLRRSLGLD